MSTRAAYENTIVWFPTEALATLVRALGAGSLRSCEMCMAPRVYVGDGRIEHDSSPPTLEEIARIDELHRGSGPPAKTAIWLDETQQGASLRIVELATSRVVYADNFTPRLREQARATLNTTRAAELERRMRGDSLVHTFFDAGLLPGQHFSLDWVEQFGANNEYLAGITLSGTDPVGGVGASFYQVIPQAFGISVGAKLLVSLPTAIVAGVSNGESGDLIDPLLTGVGVARVPLFGSSNYGLYLSASTNGTFSAGVSLMNLTLLPVIP